MSRQPFEGLRPAPSAEHAKWVVDGLRREPPGVAFVVPPGFEAIVRIHHPTGSGEPWDARIRGSDTPPEPGAVDAHEGDLSGGIADALVPILSDATASPERCHYALWVGWGDLRIGSVNVGWHVGPGGRIRAVWAKRRARRRAQRSLRRRYRPVVRFVDACARVDRWGGREMLLFDGAVSEVASVGAPLLPNPQGLTLRRRSPQWWWPDDRAWFVGSEIDDAWSYVAGPRPVIERVLALDVEAVEVHRSDTW